MKKLFRMMLSAALLAMAVSIPAFAAENDVQSTGAAPERQGDFYVLVNGEYVTFTDAVPQIKDSRSCLPFVAVFEQLGFAEDAMTWDADTQTVTATKDGESIQLTIGKKEITLFTTEESGKTTPTDVAPYIDPATNRTYVPFGLVADALGYKVGWDAAEKAVIIDDVDSILAANTATYELMDKYMDYSKTYTEKNQKVTGSYTMTMGMDMKTAGENAALKYDVKGDYNMITAGATAFQFNTDMTMDMTMMENGTDITDTALADSGMKFPLTIDMDMRGDMDTGLFYYQSKALAQLLEQPDMASAWYKVDLAALFDQVGAALGMDYASLLKLSSASLEQSFADTLADMLRVMPVTSVNATTSDYLAMLNASMADSAFKKSGTSYVSTMEEDGAKMTFTLTTNGSKVNGYSIEMTAADPTFGELKMTSAMKGSKMDLNMSMNMKMDAGDTSMNLSLNMDMDGTYQSTSSKPAVEPPANATIINLVSLMGA